VAVVLGQIGEERGVGLGGAGVEEREGATPLLGEAGDLPDGAGVSRQGSVHRHGRLRLLAFELDQVLGCSALDA
jgi:hypothetical protein